MTAYYAYDPFILSSLCPYSCSLVAFALRLGGTIDPEFLNQCLITDPKFQKAIDGLKPVPLNYETPSSAFAYQEDIYLDIDAPNVPQFFEPWGFKQYNSWSDSPTQWNSTYGNNDDLLFDFI